MRDYLKAHPDIFIPGGTEPNYFGSDLHFRRKPNLREYLHRFSDAGHQRLVGEKSTWYLYSKQAANEIKEFSPCAKILIMLRNPVEMLHSLHSEMCFGLEEDIVDFEDALAAEPDRKRGLRGPKWVFNPIECLLYTEIARYSQQVERYLQAFGRENVHVIIFDDFTANTSKVYETTLRFLGVDADFQPSFEVVNPNKRARNKTITRILRDPPRVAKLIPLSIRSKLRVALMYLNSRYEPRPRLRESLLARLRPELAPDIEALSELIGRNLTNWSRR